jgi:hypothetical protein
MLTTNSSPATAASGAVLPIHTRAVAASPLAHLASRPVPSMSMVRGAVQMSNAVEMMHSQATMFTAACSDLEKARREHPAWFDRYDEGALEQGSAAELVELMNTAPSSFTRGMVFGAFMARMEVAAATGAEF